MRKILNSICQLTPTNSVRNSSPQAVRMLTEDFSTLVIKTVGFSEKSVRLYQTTRRYITEEGNHHSHSHQNSIFHKLVLYSVTSKKKAIFVEITKKTSNINNRLRVVKETAITCRKCRLNHNFLLEDRGGILLIKVDNIPPDYTTAYMR
jgi:hypothetical protein